jgi:TetR/AcrR family transcriptional regulator, transcriptional repressor for nem operon
VRRAIFDIIVKVDIDVKNEPPTSEAAMVGVKQFDETAVIQSALDLFWRKGLVATSMLDLAEATGVQRGSLYNAYGGKDAIFLIAFEVYAERFLGMVRAALDKTDPHAALTAFFKAVIANMSSGSPARGCLTTRTAIEAAGPAVQARVRQWLDEIEATIHAALAAPGVAGRLALPPKAAAHLLVTFTRGLAVMERVHHDTGRLSETATALIRLMIRR